MAKITALGARAIGIGGAIVLWAEVVAISAICAHFAGEWII